MTFVEDPIDGWLEATSTKALRRGLGDDKLLLFTHSVHRKCRRRCSIGRSDAHCFLAWMQLLCNVANVRVRACSEGNIET